MNTEQNQTPAPVAEPPQIVTLDPAPQKNEHVGFWVYFGLIALFSIPFAGLIACIIFLFAAKKKSIRNFAGAALTWIGVGIATTVLIISLILGVLLDQLLPVIQEELGIEVGSISEVIGAASDMKDGKYSTMIRLFRGTILEAIGEEYAPLVDEFATGKYDDLIDQIKNQDYAGALEDLENGVYDDLIQKLDPEDYQELKEELQRAANGQNSDFFNELQGFFNMIPLP